MIRTAAQAKRSARQLLRFCFVNGSFDRDRALQVAGIVLEFKHRGYLGLLKEFQRLVRLEVKARVAEIESATLLPGLMEHRVREVVESKYGAAVTTVFEHKPALIGGMRIRVGSDVYDGTVQAKLAALQREFESQRWSDR